MSETNEVVLPTIIVSIRRENIGSGHTLFLVCNDEKEYRRSALGELLGIHPSTINTRMLAYGFDSPLVLHQGPINQAVVDSYGLDLVFSKNKMYASEDDYDRKRCRRDGINCTKYADCQSIRLGLTVQKWEDPGDTDNCYTEPNDLQIKYGNALFGQNGFGAYQAY